MFDFLSVLYASLPLPLFVLAVIGIAIGTLVVLFIALVLIMIPFVPDDESETSKPRRRKRRYGDDVYELEAKLLTLLRGDGGTAKRLLRLSRQQYPGHDAKWHVEKVIWDLERDRY